ncbi:MAG: glycosyltransferase [Bryobacterales bacterium]|nr:glycosyltransferase [Bryobacterales bacterium]
MAALVSVVTPTYNSAQTLARAHASVLEQTYTNWEHIIVDDGSTDNTAEVLAKISSNSQVVVLSQPNRGQGAALNRGLRHARGGYLAFLDSDDEYLPTHLADHVAYLNQNPAVDLLWGGIEPIANHPDDLLVPDMEAGEGLIHISECVVQGTIFMRQRVMNSCSFTEDRSVWWQDYDFVAKAKQKYKVERFLKATYRYYRTSADSLVSKAKAAMRAK